MHDKSKTKHEPTAPQPQVSTGDSRKYIGYVGSEANDIPRRSPQSWITPAARLLPSLGGWGIAGSPKIANAHKPVPGENETVE